MTDNLPVQIVSPETDKEVDYDYILKHDFLPINKICFIVRNKYNDFTDNLKYLFHLPCYVSSMIMSGIKCEKIKHSGSCVSPLDSFLYLKEKGVKLPSKLDNILENHIKYSKENLEITTSRDNESYRPPEEPMIKATFIGLTKVTLYLCPKARLSDIKRVIENAKAIYNLPTDRTLRNWLSEEQINLFPSNQTNEEKLKIEKKLAPLLQS